MIALYYFPGNASLAPHMVLREIGADFTLAKVDRAAEAQKSPEYLEINPAGRIPALVDGETVLFESAAICLYLADRFPEAGLAPPTGTPERGHLYKWLMFLTNTVQPQTMSFLYPEKHTADPAGVAGVKAAAEEQATQAFWMLDAALAHKGPFLLGGGEPSVADFYLLMLGRWGRRFQTPPRDMPNLKRAFDLLLDRLAVRETIRIEGLPDAFLYE